MNIPRLFGDLSLLLLILLIGIINGWLAGSSIDQLSGFRKRKSTKKQRKKRDAKRKEPHGYTRRLRRYQQLFRKTSPVQENKTAIRCFLVLWGINWVWMIAAVVLWLVSMRYRSLTWIPAFIVYISIGIFLLIGLLGDLFPCTEEEKERAKSNRISLVLRLILIVVFIVHQLRKL